MLKGTLSLALFPFMVLLVVLPYPGTVAARLLFLLASFVVALFIGLREGASFKEFPPARWSIALWASVCIFSLVYSIDPHYSLQELKNEIAYSMMVLFAFFVVGQQRENAQTLLRSLAVGFAIIGGIAVYNWQDSNFSWPEGGLQGGVGVFATYLVTCMPALFWLSIDDADVRWRWVSRVLIAFGILLGFLTLQRAIWPTLAAQLFVAIACIKRHSELRLPRGTVLAIAAAVVIVGTVAISESSKLRGLGGVADLLPSRQAFNAAIEEQTGQDGDARLPFWPKVVTTIAEHPLVGPGFGQAMMKKAYPELVPQHFPMLWHTHNVVMNYAIQMGLPGALALLVMFFGLARYFWQRMRGSSAAKAAAIAGVMLIVGVLVRNQTNDFFRRDMALLFWAQIGLFAAMCRRTSPSNER